MSDNWLAYFQGIFLFEYVVLRFWRGDLTNCYTKKSSWEAPEFHTGYFLKGRIGEDNAKYKDWSATLFLYSVLVQLMVKSTLYKYSNSYDIYFRQVALFLKVGRGRLTRNLNPQKLSISRKKNPPTTRLYVPVLSWTLYIIMTLIMQVFFQ